MTMGEGGDRSTFRTKTGWGQSGNLTVGGKTQRVTMQADFNKGVGAFDFTAQFNLTPPGEGGVVNAEALVHWRVEGQEVTRRITIGGGATLTGVGQAVRIEIYDATPLQFFKMKGLPGTATVTQGSPDVVFSVPPLNVIQVGDDIVFSTQPHVHYNIAEITGALTIKLDRVYSGTSSALAKVTVAFDRNPTQYGVSVQVSAGIRGSSGQPPLLQPYDSPPYISAFSAANPSPGTGFLFPVPLGDVLLVSIPEDAGVNQIFVTVLPANGGIPDALKPGSVNVFIENDVAIQKAWDPTVVIGWVPVPPSATAVGIVNNATTSGDIVVSISFGIDG